MKRHAISNEEGTTLVELLVAATIMLVIIAAVIAVVRTGTELEVSDSHRRVARSIISSWLEENFTHDSNGFPKLRADSSIETFPRNLGIIEKTIDPRSGEDNEIVGFLSIKLDSTVTVINSIGSLVDITEIPVYMCTSTISWQENTIQDSIVIIKRITQIMDFNIED